MREMAIRLENLSRDFETVRAVDGLSLEVPAGTIFGFLGPNGAGKTTTIRLLLGLLEPSAGQAEVLGYDACTQAQEIRAPGSARPGELEAGALVPVIFCGGRRMNSPGGSVNQKTKEWIRRHPLEAFFLLGITLCSDRMWRRLPGHHPAVYQEDTPSESSGLAVSPAHAAEAQR